MLLGFQVLDQRRPHGCVHKHFAHRVPLMPQPLAKVPPVSIISSTMTVSAFTSPIMFMTFATFALGRRLSMMAKSISSSNFALHEHGLHHRCQVIQRRDHENHVAHISQQNEYQKHCPLAHQKILDLLCM